MAQLASKAIAAPLKLASNYRSAADTGSKPHVNHVVDTFTGPGGELGPGRGGVVVLYIDDGERRFHRIKLGSQHVCKWYFGNPK